jgi:hypothetical protein
MDTESNGNVQVLGIGHLAAAVRMHLHSAWGTKPEAPESIQPLVVVCSDFPNTDSFRDANSRALAAGERILFVALAMPRVILIGPLVAPGRAGCFECVQSRRLEVSNGLGRAALPECARIGAGLAVREVVAAQAPSPAWTVTPYKGTPGGDEGVLPKGEGAARPERRLGRRWARCRACRARA